LNGSSFWLWYWEGSSTWYWCSQGVTMGSCPLCPLDKAIPHMVCQFIMLPSLSEYALCNRGVCFC
jgi:hypothetical protein